MRAFFTSAVVAASTLVAGSAFGDQCGNGLTLEVPSSASIGDTVDVDMIGPANAMALLMVSSMSSSFPSQYGTICVGFPLAFTLFTDLDANGVGQVSDDIPCDTSLVGVTVYLQFLTCGGVKRSSNLASLTIEDGICGGDLVTYTQDEYSGECNGEGGANCLLDDWFDLLFPNGLILGDQDGIDEDDEYAIVFTSAAAVENFLPRSGEPRALDKNLVDPTETRAGRFAAELAVAKITLALDDAGLLDDLKARPDLKISQLIFESGVNPDLFGLTTREVIDVCDQAISGALGSGDLDIDGDGDQDATIPNLADALNALNTNFDNGTVNLGSLKLQ